MTKAADFNTSRNFFEYLATAGFPSTFNKIEITNFLKNKLEYTKGFYFVDTVDKGVEAFNLIFEDKNAIIFPIEKGKSIKGFKELIGSSEKDEKGDDNVIFNLISKNIILVQENQLEEKSKEISDSVSKIIDGLKQDEKIKQINKYNESLLE